jgi:hypothetical protein
MIVALEQDPETLHGRADRPGAGSKRIGRDEQGLFVAHRPSTFALARGNEPFDKLHAPAAKFTTPNEDYFRVTAPLSNSVLASSLLSIGLQCVQFGRVRNGRDGPRPRRCLRQICRTKNWCICLPPAIMTRAPPDLNTGLVAAASGVAYPQPSPPGPGGRRITFASYNRGSRN